MKGFEQKCRDVAECRELGYFLRRRPGGSAELAGIVHGDRRFFEFTSDAITYARKNPRQRPAPVRCKCCGRVLTHCVSVATGIGPVCGG